MFTVKWYSKIFDHVYQSSGKGDTIQDVVENFAKVHGNTAEIKSVMMNVPCQTLIDNVGKQIGFDKPFNRF